MGVKTAAKFSLLNKILNIQEFELLVSLNVFNREKMNDAVYKFKRYEDSSLSYAGIYKHQDQPIGLYDTTIEKF